MKIDTLDRFKYCEACMKDDPNFDPKHFSYYRVNCELQRLFIPNNGEFRVAGTSMY